MTPIRLTIKGLYSYQKEQNIDFRQLTAAHLFGIFGTVGSGKSSILEAITFALYGRTDRLNLSGDNRNYNMMNLKSNELLIDFIFETGKDATQYRATVKGKRNSKQFEEVRKLDRLAYRLVNNEWIPIETGELERAIGLSYENFKRTIIIPQGQFQEFLQLKDRERTQMMKELFNLEKYEFAGKVNTLEKINNETRQHIEGQLKQLGEINPDELTQLKSQLNNLEKELTELNQLLKEKQKQAEELNKLKELTQKKQQEEEKLKTQLARKKEIDELEQRLLHYEKAHSQFKHLLLTLNESNQKQQVRQEALQKRKSEIKELNEALDALQKKLNELTPAYQKRDEQKQLIADLNVLLQLKKEEQSIVRNKIRQNKGAQILSQTSDEVEKLKKDKTEREKKLKQDRRKLPDISVLASVQAWHNTQKNLEAQLKEIENEKKKEQAATVAFNKKLTRLLTTHLFKDLPEHTTLEECQNHLSTQKKALKQEAEGLIEKQKHLEVKIQLQAYSQDLQEGQPCPLCGSTHHPEILKPENLEPQQSKLDKQKQANEKLLNQIEEAQNQLLQLEHEKQNIDNRLEAIDRKRKQLQQQIEKHAHNFKWEKYRRYEELETFLKEVEDLQESIKRQEETLEKITQNVEKKEKDRDRFQKELDKIAGEIMLAETKKETLEQQLKLIEPGDFADLSEDEIKPKIAKTEQHIEQLEKEYTETENAQKKLAEKLSQLRGSFEAIQKEWKSENQSLEKLKQEIDTELQNSPFETLDAVKKLLDIPLNIERTRNTINEYRHNIQVLREKIQELTASIGSRQYNPVEHQNQSNELKKLQDELASKNREKGKSEQQLKKLENDLKIQANLRKELRKLELRGDNIKTLKNLFKASGFVNYISSVYLQNLCQAANQRFFKLTGQKLSLEITPDNNFQVRDYLNGGKVRSVKTLSGGQTFQAALSLALALADNIQKVTESKQNFFFLDEGFGSLDKEALTTVFSTLKSLQKENRVVGVISHVEEMQQEIDVHLRIVNHEDKGSIIHESWNR